MNGAQSRLHMLLLYRSDFSSLVSERSTGPSTVGLPASTHCTIEADTGDQSH